ncbi:TetR/AcrR family transcriptional regulator C-terminal domain-containing protein [Kitasatospora sp. NBC_01287]|uniref:TetR/AcrR family transcriptional regulator C-terminal domain-containing protein n=1 Tax=Kitasatospora sp. NBC_01287 TaxID=2903573 RepID=UPI00225AFE05|nr:TetR/AcrR family transcriptional regulator C-terminal domain-containing protein [Kitasatospora sp. NBC_01287]MCX4745716.1 TetR/AcrR family transcriptional regulator C-terminal domain-containing protein [Kitasatospora sp. NBC_01287]
MTSTPPAPSTPPGPPPANKPGRPAVLSHDAIVGAAVALIDAEGLEALTMRRLGAELDVRAMSLYRHLPNRDAVLAAVVNRLAASTEVEVDPGAQWPEALHRLAHAYRRTLLAHPHAVVLLATYPVDAEVGQAMVAEVLARFDAAGITVEQALTAVQSVGVFVLGHALAQVGTPPGAEQGGPVASAGFYEEWFAAGLDAMVLGFRQRLGSR